MKLLRIFSALAMLSVFAIAQTPVDITKIKGSAPSTAGKIDAKCADGDCFVQQPNGTNFHVDVDNVISVVGTFWQAIQPISSTQMPAALDGSGFFKVHEQGTVPVTGTFWQAIQPVSQSGSWAVTASGNLGRTWTLSSGTDSVAVTGTFWQATQPVSGTFWQATQPVSGPLTDTQLRATPVPVSGTVTATGGLTDAELRASPVPVSAAQSGSWSVTATGNLGRSWTLSSGTDSIAVTGTFWQATQPVSGTFWQATQPVSGTFWQATQPVSLASGAAVDGAIATLGSKADAADTHTDATAISVVSILKELSAKAQAPASTPVTGTFWPGTQPVSLVSGAAVDGAIATLGLKADAADTHTDATAISVVSILKELSAKAQAPASTPVTGTFWPATQPVSAGVGDVKVGFDPTTPGTTNAVSMLQPARTTGTITSNTSTISVATTGYSIATVTANGTYAGVTVNFEFSDDGGTTWYADTCTRTDTNVQESSEVLPSNQTRAWDCGIVAASNFRVRSSAYSSGTANIGITISAAPIEPAPTVAVSGTVPVNILTYGTGVIDPCLNQTKSFVSVTQTASAKLVTGTSAKKIYVCSINLMSSSAQDVALVEGTGSTCGTSTTGVLGFGGATAATGYQFAANGGIAYGNGGSSIGAEGVAADDLCLFQSAAGAGNQVSGGLSYVVQ